MVLPAVQSRPAVPHVKNDAWANNDDDRFAPRQTGSERARAYPPADKRTLIRRVYYDLIGLPPSAEQVEAFWRTIGRRVRKVLDATLLRSPRYGERWARHWLEWPATRMPKAVRPTPRKRRIYPNAWTYRDYVIAPSTRTSPSTGSSWSNWPPTPALGSNQTAVAARLSHGRRPLQRQSHRDHQ